MRWGQHKSPPCTDSMYKGQGRNNNIFWERGSKRLQITFLLARKKPPGGLRCQAGAKTWDEENILIFKDYSEPAKLAKVVFKPPKRIEICLVHINKTKLWGCR